MPGKTNNSAANQPSLTDLITFEQAAQISGFTTRHIRKLADTKQLWAVKLGRNWFTIASAVHDYLAKDRRPGPKPKKPNTST